VTTSVFKKICLLGDFAVGKTSLVRRYVDNQFSDEYLSTIGVKLSRKLIHISRGNEPSAEVQLVLWDLEGNDDFASVSHSYLRGAHGAIIVGDQTRPETILNTKKHIRAFLTVNPKAFVAVAYNKEDLRAEGASATVPSFGSDERVVLVQPTSAKIGQGVTPLFEALCQKLLTT
jgi:small GTP-binding protein